MKKLNLLICAFLLLGTGVARAQYTDLVDFTGDNGAYPGSAPEGCSLTPSITGDTLYGMTFNGGTDNEGVIFSYDRVANVYTDLINFTGLTVGHEGRYPNGALTLLNGVLYGMTSQGGLNDYGVIFSYDPVANVYTVLYNFTGEATGRNPEGSFTLFGGLLYGMTSYGGTASYGNIFSFNPVGNVYTNLYSFADAGDHPSGLLTLSGGIFYGTTPGGGTGKGNIFSFNPAGNIYTDVVDFTGESGADTGQSPNGTLTLVGGLLYGTTPRMYNYGNIFSYNPVTNVYTNLLDFGGAITGRVPLALTLSGGLLYGMTNDISACGRIFSFDPVGNVYNDLYDFNGTDACQPHGGMILSGGILYGMTSVNNGNIFSFYDTSITAGINKIAASTGVKLYPNPNNGVFTIQSSGTSSKPFVEIYNMVGAKVFAGLLGSAQGDNTINISSQPDGVYLYRVSDENRGLIDQGKIIIEK